MGVNSQNTLKANYLKFFSIVFRRVYDELEKCQEELSRKHVTTAGDLARWWSSHLGSIRTELYKVAIDGAGEPIKVSTRGDSKKLVIVFVDSSRSPEEA